MKKNKFLLLTIILIGLIGIISNYSISFTKKEIMAATVCYPYQGCTGQDTSNWTGYVYITNGTWGTTTVTGGGSLWTDAGTYTYLTDTSSDLVVGDNSTSTAPFWVDVSSGNLVITGNLSSADSFLTSESDPIFIAASSSLPNLHTVGTIGTGTWQGTAIADAFIASSTEYLADNDTHLSQEEVEDYVGGMLDGTETLITVDYVDGSGNINFIVNDDLSQYSNATSGFLTSVAYSDLTGYPADVITAGTLIDWSASTTLNVDNDLHNYNWGNVVDADITDTLTCSTIVDADKGDVVISSGVWNLDTNSVADNEIDYSNVTLSDFTNDADYATTGSTVAKANALASNPSNCSSGQAPLGIDASGNVESCFDVWTEAENTAAGYISTVTPDDISASNATTDEYVLSYEATGDTFEWVAMGGGVTSLNTLTGALTIWGTSNQITVTASGTAGLIMATPQDIHTGASPTFAGLTLSGLDTGFLKVDGSGNVSTSTIDISSDTNLAVSGTLLDLTGDTLSVNEGTLADGKLCKYVAGTGLDCNYTDQDTTYSAGTGLDLTGTTFSLSHLGLESLTDPNANRLLYWNDTGGATGWLDYSAWDTDNSDDLTTGTTFSGDVSGAYNNLTIQANSVALGTDTTGNYAAGDAEGGNATGLACSGCVDVSSETNLVAGRSLTLNNDTIDIDSEIYTDSFSITIKNATTTANPAAQRYNPVAITITEIGCRTDSGTSSIQFDERTISGNSAGTDVMSSGLVCDSDTATTTSFANSSIAADTWLSLDIDSISSATDIFIFVQYTIND